MAETISVGKHEIAEVHEGCEATVWEGGFAIVHKGGFAFVWPGGRATGDGEIDEFDKI